MLLGHFAVPQGRIIRDITADRGQIVPQALATYSVT
jgi:hypothetical protein